MSSTRIAAWYAMGSTLDRKSTMTTKNPRVVGYVSPENHTQLKEFVKQQGLTESKAIDVIFSQFFGTASLLQSSKPSSTPQELSERVAVLEQQMTEVMGESVA